MVDEWKNPRDQQACHCLGAFIRRSGSCSWKAELKEVDRAGVIEEETPLLYLPIVLSRL